MVSIFFALLFSPPPPSPPAPKFRVPVPSQEDLEELLVRQLSHEDPRIRKHAADVLAELGPQAGFAAPALWKAHRAEYKGGKKANTEVVHACHLALEAIGPPVVPMLTKIVASKEESEFDREQAVRLLGDITYKHRHESIKESIPVLIEAASERNRVGTATLITLRNARETAIDALPTLERMFEKASGWKRLDVAHCLVSIGGSDHPQAKPYFEKLKKDLELIQAAAKNDLAQVRRSIRSGANVNASAMTALGYFGAPGYTALIYASLNGNEEMVKLLLESGADPNYELSGKTALDFAKTEAVKAVLKKAGGRPGPGDVPVKK